MATTTQNLGKVGLVDKGTYNASTTYSRLDFVTDSNNVSTYISIKDSNKGNALTNTTYWRYLAKGTADATVIRDLLKTVDGSGSGIDADTLDGVHLTDIVNPEAVAAANSFDFFLGAKEIDGQWVFQKMAPSDVATVVAELTGARCFKVKNTNTGLLTVNINDLVGGTFKAPLKWELTGCQWGSAVMGYAYGLCRYDTDSSGTSASVLGKFGFSGEPSASVSADGVFTLTFGMQWSAAELRVYY